MIKSVTSEKKIRNIFIKISTLYFLMYFFTWIIPKDNKLFPYEMHLPSRLLNSEMPKITKIVELELIMPNLIIGGIFTFFLELIFVLLIFFSPLVLIGSFLDSRLFKRFLFLCGILTISFLIILIALFIASEVHQLLFLPFLNFLGLFMNLSASYCNKNLKYFVFLNQKRNKN